MLSQTIKHKFSRRMIVTQSARDHDNVSLNAKEKLEHTSTYSEKIRSYAKNILKMVIIRHANPYFAPIQKTINHLRSSVFVIKHSLNVRLLQKF